MTSRQRSIAWTGYAALCIALAILFFPQVRTAAETHTAIYWIYLLLCSFLVSFLFMPLLLRFAKTWGIIDNPDNRRKGHTVPTPMTGGIAIFLGFSLTLLFNFHFSAEMKAVLISSAIIFIIGLIDDRWGLSARLRLIFQICAALILIYFGVRVTFVPDYLGGIYVETIITLIWIIGITNSMNFVDGMDGLAAGTSITYSIFFAIIALLTGQTYMMYLSVAVAGACMGFFPYNFRPGNKAAAFLGDSGATFLGFIMASFALMGTWGDNIIDLAVPVIIMSVLIFDMTLTTIVRIYKGDVKTFSEWLRFTGRDHFHHRLMALGLGEKAAAWLFFSVSVCFGLEALAMLFSKVWVSLVILAHSILVFFIIGVILVLRNSGASTASGPASRHDNPCNETD